MCVSAVLMCLWQGLNIYVSMFLVFLLYIRFHITLQRLEVFWRSSVNFETIQGASMLSTGNAVCG